jgi:hypothetical protein
MAESKMKLALSYKAFAAGLPVLDTANRRFDDV